MPRPLKRQAPAGSLSSAPQVPNAASDGGFFFPDTVALSVTDSGFPGAMAAATGPDVTGAAASFIDTVILVAPSGTNAGQVIVTSVPVSQTGGFSLSSPGPTATDSFSASLPSPTWSSQWTSSSIWTPSTTWSSTASSTSVTTSSTTSRTSSSTSSSTTSTSSKPSTTSSSTTHTVTQASATASPPHTTNHLSTGATAAIAVLVPLIVLAAAAGIFAWFCLRRRGRYQRSPKVYPEEAYLYDPPMPRSGAHTTTRGSSEAAIPLITLNSAGGHEYAAHPLPSAAVGGGSAPSSSGDVSVMSGALAARAATPDRGGTAGGDSAGVFRNRMVDYAAEREGLLSGPAGAPTAGGGDPNPYAGGAYGAEPMLPPMPQPPAPTVAVALPFVANARGAYARAPTSDEAEAADGLEPYSDVPPAMREDAAVAAAAAAGVDPFRDVHPALRDQQPLTAYDPGHMAMSADDKEIAPSGPG